MPGLDRIEKKLSINSATNLLSFTQELQGCRAGILTENPYLDAFHGNDAAGHLSCEKTLDWIVDRFLSSLSLAGQRMLNNECIHVSSDEKRKQQ